MVARFNPIRCTQAIRTIDHRLILYYSAGMKRLNPKPLKVATMTNTQKIMLQRLARERAENIRQARELHKVQ
jgi:hypothetical protein